MLSKIVAAAAPVIAERFTPNACLNASRILIEVCRELGYPARAMPVEAVAANRAWWEFAVAHGRMPTGAECPDGWAVGCAHDHRETEEGYEGHLVVWTQGALVDLSSGQMHRPQRAIFVPTAISMPTPAGWERGHETLPVPLPQGGVLTYLALPKERAFKRAPGFQRSDHNLDAAREIRARLLATA